MNRSAEINHSPSTVGHTPTGAPPWRMPADAGRLVLVLTAALLVGIAIAVDLRITVALLAAVLAAATVHTRMWLTVMTVVIAGLVLLSWGFNNIPFPAGGLAIPLVDVLLLYALVASFPLWWSATTQSHLGKRLLLLLCALAFVAAVRLALDIPRFGVVAGRDALYVLEAWAVLVGIAVGRAIGAARADRALALLWRLAVLFFLLFPLRDFLAELGPEVGVQRPIPLIQFTTAGFIAATSLFWFLQEQRRSAPFFAGLSLLVLLMVQVRGQLLAVAATFIIGSLLRVGPLTSAVGGRGLPPVARRACIVIGTGLLVVALLPPIPGRLEEPVGLDTVTAQLKTLAGEEGPGSGSLEHRAETWPKVVDKVLDSRGGWLVGVGYGPDLFFGFTIDGDVEVRKPHNDFLEIWARTGLVGFLPWVALLGTLALWAFRAAPRSRYGWWLLALQISVLASALTQPAFAFAYIGLVYMFLMGLRIGTHPRARHPRSVPTNQ